MTKQYFPILVLACITSGALFAEPESKSPAQLREQIQTRGILTNDYVHKWIKFPTVSGEDVFKRESVSYRPREGRAMVVWTLSVSSLKSQDILPELQRMQQRFEGLFTDFVYVFVNDLPENVRNFVQEWELDGRIVLGEDEFKEAFKYKQPPTVYVADRFGWLNWMQFALERKDLPEIERYLEQLNTL